MDAGVDQHEKNFMYKFYRELDPNMEELNHWMIADFDRINHGYGAVFEEDFEELKDIWQLQPRYTDAEKEEDLENFDKAGEYQRKTMIIMRVPK